MQQSDYILREIEKIGAMIMGIIGKMIRKKEDGAILNEDDYSVLKSQLHETASLDIEELLNSDAESLEGIFQLKKGYNETNIELVADLLAELAGNPINIEATLLRKKALEIYQYNDKTFKTFSIERMKKMNELKRVLKIVE